VLFYGQVLVEIRPGGMILYCLVCISFALD